MNKLQFSIHISAPIHQVFDIMLGISDISTYEQWTALFNPTSSYKGNWEKGSKMLFVGCDENGEKGGMVSEIANNVLNQFISIRHYGLVKGGVEITTGPDVEKWANGYENYTFEAQNDSTIVKVDMDITPDFSAYMNETYPKALAKLKEICEK
jgi:hypothetical protein